VADPEWRAILQKPATIVFTFLDESGRPVADGELGLEWADVLG
jgi:hypothetical protein